MDSMRSLNTSLPASTSRRRRGQPNEQLLQTFRAAALSVTNLYKTAALEQDDIRQSGYQDALDDLLAFLDRENLGLGDGEGWRVRQWATERLDGSGMGPTGSESEDERNDGTKNTRNRSPTLQRRLSEDMLARQVSRSMSPIRNESAPPTAPPSHSNGTLVQTPPAFTFTSGQSMPQPQEIEMQSSDGAGGNDQIEPSNLTRLDTVPRGSRTPHRQGGRVITRASMRDLGQGAGTKRKIPFGDFFDISTFGNGRDPFGGGNGKRGRFT